MPDVLNHDEVDALLDLVNQVDSAAIEPESSSEAGISRTEGYNTVPLSSVHIYDFKRPERVSKEQVTALEALHETFARNASASLSAYLRTIVEVRLISVEQFTYSEFTMSLPSPTSFNLLSVEPLEGNVILEVNPSILFPIIDRLLGGGKSESYPLDRPFTHIEQRLVNSILARILEQLRETWESIRRIEFQIVESESNPFLLQIVAPNEPIVLLSFEISMGDYSGMINLCIPFKVIEPLMAEFSQSNWFSRSRRRGDKATWEAILRNLSRVPVGVAAVVAETTIRLADLLALRPGDILDTGHSARLPIDLFVEGKRKFRGRPAAAKGRKAFRVTASGS